MHSVFHGLLAIAALTATTVPGAEADYRFFLLDSLLGVSLGTSTASGINNAGEVVGSSNTFAVGGRAVSNAYVLQDRTMINLGLDDGLSFPWDISANGTVVGYRIVNQRSLVSRAFVYRDGSFTELDAFGYLAEATGINDAGTIVGTSSLRAVRWENQVLTDLGTLGGTSSRPMAINNQGVIVGASTNASGALRAFRYDSGTMTDLGTLGGAQSQANDINDAGLIVGWSETAEGRKHAVIFSAEGIIDLGVMSGAGSEAHSINGIGDVVGELTRSGQKRPFVYRQGVMIDLMPYLVQNRFSEGTAIAINDRGQIVGHGTRNGIVSRDLTRAFLLTPTSESFPELVQDPRGFAFTMLTDGTNGRPRFTAPYGIARTPDGTLFVTDLWDGAIRKVTPSGQVSTVTAVFQYPHGIAANSYGELFVTDEIANTVWKLTSSGIVSKLAGPGNSSETGSSDGFGDNARFNRPAGIASDPAGNVYVADTYNHTIRRITPDGSVSTFAGLAGTPGSADGTGSGARFWFPQGIACDATGNLYVADSENHIVRRITPNSEVSTIAGLAGTSGAVDGSGAAARFNYPATIAVDGSGHLYVAETFNRAIRRISPTGMVTSIAGSFLEPGSSDGAATDARFSEIRGIVVESESNLILTDTGNRTIRRLSGGNVTTLAGVPGSSGSLDGVGSVRYTSGGRDIEVDSQGNAYFTDSGNGVIRKLASDGTVTILAGRMGFWGYADGQGATALFNNPTGLGLDNDGNVYVADTGNSAIRKVTPDGVVSTVGGVPGEPGTLDGAPGRLWNPIDVVVGKDGTIFVAEYYYSDYFGIANSAIRIPHPGGPIVTFAGNLNGGVEGAHDGQGRNAAFDSISGITMDRHGNIYVVDPLDTVIRRVDPEAVVTTVRNANGEPFRGDGLHAVAADPAGALYVLGRGSIRRVIPGDTETEIRDALSGDAPPFDQGLQGIAVGSDGSIFCISHGMTVDDPRETVYRGFPVSLPRIDLPTSVSGVAGERFSISVAGPSNGLLRFQWRLNGVDVPGAVSAEFEIPILQRSHGGTLSAIITVDGVSFNTNVSQLSVSPPKSSTSRLLNLSTRGLAQTGDNVLIPGFTVTGTGTKKLLIRAVGPTLALDPFFVTGTLADPRMRLLKRKLGTGAFEEIAANDNWGTNNNAIAITQTAADLWAFPFGDDREAALLMDLAPGEYTVIAGGVNDLTGIALAELYDADAPSPTARLANISNRGFAGVGDQVMIPGFVVSSEGPKTLLVRVVGPTLGGTPFNVPGTMADPKLEIFPGGGSTPILTNDNWSDNPDAAYTAQVAQQLFAFPLGQYSKDAAFVVTLPPGGYTVVGSSATAGGTGVVLVEVYVVP